MKDPILNLKGYLDGVKPKPSDQFKGAPRPDFEKPLRAGPRLIALPDPAGTKLKKADVRKCIADRKSVRAFAAAPVTLRELSLLLWATQGVRELVSDEHHMHHAIKRMVPSAGSRHPFETYFAARQVDGLPAGIYRYIGSKHAVVLEAKPAGLGSKVSEAAIGQAFCGKAPLFLLWSAVPYRTIWRYGLPKSVKCVLLDAGHIGQNLHLACEALGLGTCMIGAYRQSAMDKLFGLDGKTELAVYMAPVGHKLSA
ncbi:MAG: SagB/ThcOx family dehydrogenase [Elusimicrobiales bacterium]|nr:SagB/ThcOx family dehydrogenase [Elusimicrobiales bacterium]